MFRCVLLAVLCLVSAPCFADINITEDTTLYSIPDDYVLVLGDATLTLIEGPNGEIPSAYSISLADSASLVMEAGRVNRVDLRHPRGCDYEERCPTTHSVTASNSYIGRISASGDHVTGLVVLNDSEFDSLGLGNTHASSAISINYSASFNADGFGSLSGNVGRISFSAPGASYEANDNGRFEFLYTDPSGVHRSPFLSTEDEWFFTEAKRVSIIPTDRTLLAGDVNGDGQVGIADLNEVRNNFGRPIFPDGTALGDSAPYNVMIDIADLNAVRNNFGSSLNQPVPEPTTFIMALAGIALSCTLARPLNLKRQPTPRP